MAGIFALSSIPGEQSAGSGYSLAPIPSQLQNLLHLPLYGTLAWTWAWCLGMRMKGTVLLVAAFAIAAGYGVLDELHQLAVPGRYASLADTLLNTLGAAAGVLWYRRRSRQPV